MSQLITFIAILNVFLCFYLQTFSSHVSENSGNSLKLLNMFSSSVKTATTYVMLKNPDPGYIKHAKYFAGACMHRTSEST